MGPLAVVLPRRCGICGVPGESVCRRCRRDLVRISPPVCDRCGTPGPWPVRRCVECVGRRLAFTSARAALVYERQARAFVVSWKERGRRDLAAAAAELVAQGTPRPAADVLTFVPSDSDRRLRRGQAGVEAFARELATIWGMEVEPLVERCGTRRRQRGLPLAERRANVRGAFVARARSPAVVCLVDDVYTTGATAGSCATALRRAGARRVDVVTLARAIRSG